MDPEQTFLRVHARLSGMLARLLTPRLRAVLEHLFLLFAIMLLGLLAVMHVNFVDQPGCAKEFSGNDTAQVPLLRIKVTGYGLWSTQGLHVRKQSESGETLPLNGDGLKRAGKSWLNWMGVNARRSKAGKKIVKNDRTTDVSTGRAKTLPESISYKPMGRQTETSRQGVSEAAGWPFFGPSRGSLGTGLMQVWDRWISNAATFLEIIKQTVGGFWRIGRIAGRELFTASSKDEFNEIFWNGFESTFVHWLEKRSEAFEPVYIYGVEKGYLMLSEVAKFQHNVRTFNISISARNPCFGNRWQQLLINSFVGYDTILMNSLLNARGEGYLYNFQTKELYDLKYLRDSSGVPNSFEGYIVSKSGVLIMSLFVFFTTTMSVSFTLRETQARMLKFTVQLQYHARHRLPTFRLIFIHVIESLVFVPIMIGILFFLFEFYDDQLLAFMVLTLVWLCELFTMISVRTPMSMQYFPRFFLLYFLAFHIYFFSYEYGFSYLTFSTTAAFMQHLVLYFWNHFEVPALQRFLRARTLLQQQSGVQITSSAIITSTFHITRLRPAGSSTGAEANSRLSVPSAVRENASSNAANPGIVSYRANISSNSTPLEGNTESVGVDSIRDFGVRLGDEILDGGGRISSRTINSTNARAVANEDRSSPGRDRDGETDTGEGTNPQGAEPGLHSSESPNHLVQPSHLTSFGSVLLWILGGTSENLVSILPVFRDLRDQGLNRGNTSGHSNEDGDSERSLHGTSGSSEGLRQRSGYASEDTERT